MKLTDLGIILFHFILLFIAYNIGYSIGSNKTNLELERCTKIQKEYLQGWNFCRVDTRECIKVTKRCVLDLEKCTLDLDR